ncbi:NAD(P)-binding domain-containing protein [Leisingera aquimarina]|uniref:NAD(P)-binding domain-containing protein n=1 Tax=Leisingera aquimarina TaxID=476529 RepID=UPI0004071D18|nr:NAD(P)-binding domain-containing protein [Leisingera aquimarina]
MKLGFLGFGSIASAVAQGCVADGHDLWISERSTTRSSALAAAHGNVSVADMQAIVDHAEVVFLGTTAETAPGALAPLSFRAGQKVISFMVGIETDEIKKLIAPAEFEAIMIPFPSIAEGNSPVLTYPQSDTIDAIFGASNTVVSVASEAALNDFLAAQAVLSPIVKLLATAVDWLATRTGDYHGSEQFLRLLVGGSLMAKPMDARKVLPELIEALNTPGGLNRQFREQMECDGAFAAAKRGLDDLGKRLSGES